MRPEPEQSRSIAVDLSHEVIGAAIDVHRLLGPGLLESIYEAALCKELSFRGIEFERQKRSAVTYKGQLLDCDFRLDLLVARTIIVEVKATGKITPLHKAQLLSYLRINELWLGLLINFNVELLRDGIRRVLNG
jgi:GxxExxY protein